MTTRILFWRRIDVESLERLELRCGSGGILAVSTIVSLEAGGARLDYRWRLDPGWRTLAVTVSRRDAAGRRVVRLERAGSGWRVDGVARVDLDGAEEPDLSATPFCNTLPIRRTPQAPGSSLSLDTAFIDADTLVVARSCQRYDRLGPRRLRYVDLGLSRGFEAELEVDEAALVLRYQHLFERITPA